MILKKVLREVDRELRLIAHKYPARVRCNVCGWRGRTFLSDSWHPHTICARCRSQVRHRLLFAALQTHPELGFDQLVKGKRVLHFAPERFFPRHLRTIASQYVTADFVKKYSLDLQLDMCDMQCIADASYDLVIACDVLEHVPSDSVALSELNRVLFPGGWAILTVPQVDGMASKREDATITTPAGREAAFGQVDHLRIYGDDFAGIVEEHGFRVTTIDADSFPTALVEENVLFPPVLSDKPLATNHRKVFFAQKSS